MKKQAILLTAVAWAVVLSTSSQMAAQIVSQPIPIDSQHVKLTLARKAKEKKKLSQPMMFEAWITAYSSTPEETDSTPFITATGERVKDGIVATNILPFNTLIKIPAIFGDKVFVVKDRMHPRKKDFVDIWMPTKSAAKNFGIYREKVMIVSLPQAHNLTLNLDY